MSGAISHAEISILTPLTLQERIAVQSDMQFPADFKVPADHGELAWSATRFYFEPKILFTETPTPIFCERRGRFCETIGDTPQSTPHQSVFPFGLFLATLAALHLIPVSR